MTLRVQFYTDNVCGALKYSVEDSLGRVSPAIPYNTPIIIEDNLGTLWGIRRNLGTDRMELVQPALVLVDLTTKVDPSISLVDAANMLERSASGLPPLCVDGSYLVFPDGGIGIKAVNIQTGMAMLKTQLSSINKANLMADSQLSPTTSEDIDMSALEIDMYVHVVDGDYHRIESRFTSGSSVPRNLPCVSADHTYIAVGSRCLEVATSDTRAPGTLTSWGRMYSKVSAMKVLLDMVYAQAGYV